MFRTNENKSEAYWKSYNLLEDELIRLSHSISFDDEQINVYSTELADIINSACVKIESISKDIYEDHVLPFQLDNNVVPNSYKSKNFELKKWTRECWNYDYNCLVEINSKYNIKKKSINLKLERFNFHKYGSLILPFYNIDDNCKGGKWEFASFETFESPSAKRFEDIDWCKSYQQIKHNYINSINKHATIKNAIMTLAAYYILLVYNSCLPFKQFDFDNNNTNYNIDFGSKIFSCNMCNFTRPAFIIDSKYEKHIEAMKIAQESSPFKKNFEEEAIFDGYDSCMFLVTLNNEKYLEVKEIVNQYCQSHNILSFDVAPYENGLSSDNDGKLVYDKICKITKVPYYVKDVKISLNIGIENIYENYNITNNYEKLKYQNRKIQTLKYLKIGDYVNIKLSLNDKFNKCKIINLTNQNITLEIIKGEKTFNYSAPLCNIIYIDKIQKDD